MSPELLTLIVAAAAGLGTLFLGLALADRMTAAGRDVAGAMGGAGGEGRGQVIRALGHVFAPVGAPFPGLAAKLDIDLTHAGRPHGGIDGQRFLAAAAMLSLGLGLGVGALFGFAALLGGEGAGTALERGLRWALFAVPGVLVFLILDLKGQARTNSFEIEREFPFFLDLAVLVVQAGGTPRRALAKYVEAAPGTPLSREIAITAKDADSTSFEAALLRMMDRVEPPSVKAILKNLAQGEKTSGEVEAFYASQAEELRHLREEMANRTAERIKTSIVFPVFLMLSAIVVAALAPTIVSIRSQGFF